MFLGIFVKIILLLEFWFIVYVCGNLGNILFLKLLVFFFKYFSFFIVLFWFFLKFFRSWWLKYDWYFFILLFLINFKLWLVFVRLYKLVWVFFIFCIFWKFDVFMVVVIDLVFILILVNFKILINFLVVFVFKFLYEIKRKWLGELLSYELMWLFYVLNCG